MASKLLYNNGGYRSFEQNFNKIEDKYFINLEGYGSYAEDTPTGFFFIDDISNGAMLVSLLKIKENDN